MDDARLAETIDYVAIRRLQNAYADVVTRRAWSELTELFLPDAVIEVDTRRGDPRSFDGPEALGAFIAEAVDAMAFFEFVVLNTRIEIGVRDDPDAATGRLYMCELRQHADSGHRTDAFGVYHDRYRRRGGRWWFDHRRYHSLARTAAAGDADMDVFDFPHHLRLDEL